MEIFVSRAWRLALCVVGVLATAGCHAYDESLLRVQRGNRGSASRSDPSSETLDAATGLPDSGSGDLEPGDASADSAAAAADASSDRGDETARPSDASVSSGNGGAGSSGEGGAPAAGGGKGTAGAGGTAGMPSDSASGGAAGSGNAPPAVTCTEAGGRIWPASGHCYFPLSVRNSWFISRDRCSELKAHLVSIAGADEQTFVSGLVSSAPAWIGLSRFGAPAFSWVDGQSVTYENWDTDAPNLTNEAAVALRPETFFWFDDDVSAQHPAICERE